jgi:hypothetical protein
VYEWSARLRRELDCDGLVPLKRLLRLSAAEFRRADELLHYAQSWAFTHFLLESGSENHRKLWDDYFEAIRYGLSKEAAYDRVFKPIDMEALERAYRNHIECVTDFDGVMAEW